MTRAELIEALKSAKGPDRRLDHAILKLWLDHPGSTYFTASLDAAISLVERVRPGWNWSVGNSLAGWAATVSNFKIWTEDFQFWKAEAATPAISLLIALLSSMED